MKLYAIIEFDSDSDTDLHLSKVRRTLKQARLPGDSQARRVGVCTQVECSQSIMMSLETPFYHQYSIKISDILVVDVVAVDSKDAIEKARSIVQDHSEFVIHNKPEWWEINIIE